MNKQVYKYECTNCGDKCILFATENPMSCPLADTEDQQFNCSWEEVK